jgi:hypothetical protein
MKEDRRKEKVQAYLAPAPSWSPHVESGEGGGENPWVKKSRWRPTRIPHTYHTAAAAAATHVPHTERTATT